MTTMELIGILVVLVLVALPPKYDPAIRLKELLDRKRKDWRS